jgi:hypothetical protein
MSTASFVLPSLAEKEAKERADAARAGHGRQAKPKRGFRPVERSLGALAPRRVVQRGR